MKINGKNILYKYLPDKSVDIVYGWIVENKINLKITRERKTKLGDYRWLQVKNEHSISVNGNLNEYSFLITLIHEIAHLKTWERYKKKVKPHGIEWKEEFRFLIHPFLLKDIFPTDINLALKKYMKNPSASSCTDVILIKALKRYDEVSDMVFLEEIEENSSFRTANGKVFSKGEQIRKRYKCKEVSTTKTYLFSPVTEVLKI